MRRLIFTYYVISCLIGFCQTIDLSLGVPNTYCSSNILVCSDFTISESLEHDDSIAQGGLAERNISFACSNTNFEIASISNGFVHDMGNIDSVNANFNLNNGRLDVSFRLSNGPNQKDVICFYGLTLLQTSGFDSFQECHIIRVPSSGNELQIHGEDNASQTGTSWETNYATIYVHPKSYAHIIPPTGVPNTCLEDENLQEIYAFPATGSFTWSDPNGKITNGINSSPGYMGYYPSNLSSTLQNKSQFGDLPDSTVLDINYAGVDLNGCPVDTNFNLTVYGTQIIDQNDTLFKIDSIPNPWPADSAAYDLYHGLDVNGVFMLNDGPALGLVNQGSPTGEFIGYGVVGQKFIASSAFYEAGEDDSNPIQIQYAVEQENGRCPVRLQNQITIRKPYWVNQNPEDWYSITVPNTPDLCVGAKKIQLRVTKDAHLGTVYKPLFEQATPSFPGGGVFTAKPQFKGYPGYASIAYFNDSVMHHYHADSLTFDGVGNLSVILDSTFNRLDSIQPGDFDVHPYLLSPDTLVWGQPHRKALIDGRDTTYVIPTPPAHDGRYYSLDISGLQDSITSLDFRIHYTRYTYSLVDSARAVDVASFDSVKATVGLTLELTELPKDSIFYLEDFYCGLDSDPIIPSMEGQVSNFYFSPWINELGDTLSGQDTLATIEVNRLIPANHNPGTYIVKGSSHFLQGETCVRHTQDTLVILRNPEVQITKEKHYCEFDTIQLTPDSLYPNTTYTWNFDNGYSFDTNSVWLSYPQNGIKKFNVWVSQNFGAHTCSFFVQDSLIVGARPNPQASYAGLCQDDTPTLYNLSTIDSYGGFDQIDSVSWMYQNSQIGSTDTVMYDFGSQVKSKVWIYSYSAIGCYDSAEVNIVTIPYVYADDLEPYRERFEDATQWYESTLLTQDSTYSWQLSANSTGTNLSNGTNIWVTNEGNNSYYKSENSWVMSPCLSFEGMNKPTLYFDARVDMEETVDGVVLQYALVDGNISVDSLQWNVLGTTGSGKNWYHPNYISANPGSQNALPLGWTGYTDSSIGLQPAIHKLDAVQSQLQGRKVVFRFALASNDNNPTHRNFEGFAFDNIEITPRNKVVLIEHFTNTTDANCQIQRASQQTLLPIASSNDFVWLNYHVNYPYVDSLHYLNRPKLSAKSLVYKVDLPPYTAVSGGVPLATDGFQDLSGWAYMEYQNEAIDRAAFQLQLTVDSVSQNEMTFSSNTSLEGVVDTTADYRLFTVVYADSLFDNNTNTWYRNVVVDILPDANGLKINHDWLSAYQSKTPWTPTVSLPQADYKVVSYIQNDSSKYVYQATAPISLTSVPEPVQRYSNPSANAQNGLSGLTVYPNPVEDVLQINSADQKMQDLKVVDQMGKVCFLLTNINGNSYTMNVASLAVGAYTLCVSLSDGTTNSIHLVKK